MTASAVKMEAVADKTDVDVVYNTERKVRFMAYPRARDHQLVTGAW